MTPWWMLLLACGGADPADPSDPARADDSATPVVCDGSFRAPTVLATGFEVDGITGTEGLAFSPDGRLFVGGSGVTGGGYVAEVFPSGDWEMVASVPSSVGMVWHEGELLVATGDVGDGTGGLVGVDVDSGGVRVVASGIPSANFPAVTPWGTVLVSSPSGTTLWEVDGNEVREWVSGVPSPNGMAFSPDGRTLYVANTYDAPSTVAAIDVVDEEAGAIGVLATLPDGSTQDGVAIDAEGHLYVVNNLPGTIVRIAPDGTWETIAEGVAFGASLAFGVGDYDPCALYVSSLFSADVFEVAR